MDFTKVTIRDETATLMLRDGIAAKGDGKLTVKGKLEPGVQLKVGAEYKIVGEPGLQVKLPYLGSPAPGKYEFKID